MVGCSTPRGNEVETTPTHTQRSSTLTATQVVDVVGTTESLTTDVIPISTTPFQTPTYLPTLSAGEAWQAVFDLLQNNNGCQFPCIWGLLPGENNSQEAAIFLGSFGSISELHIFDTGGGTTFEISQNDLMIIVRLDYYHENGIVSKLEVHAMGLRQVGDNTEGAGVFSDSSINPLLRNYTPSKILSDFGQPSKILIGGFYDDRGPLSSADWVLSTVMDYSDSGFILEYLNFGTGLNESFIGCPFNAWSFTLWSWPVEKQLSLEEAVSIGVAGGSGGINKLNFGWFRPIEEATTMATDEFYQTFKDAQNTACFETPVELWEP